MRNWLRPWSARPQRRPLRSKFVYHKPSLEPLEDRTVPTVMSLQLGTTSLGLYGDFNFDSSTSTYTSATGSDVVVGEYDTSTQTVENALEIDDGTVTYVSTNNADGQFQVNGVSGAFSLLAYQTGSAPTTTLFSSTQQTFTASQLASTSGQALSYTIDTDNFDLTLTNLGIADDPNSGQNNSPSVWLQGDLTVPLAGDDSSIPATIADTNYLYANSSGFDFSSLVLQVSENFEYFGVTFAVQGGLTLDFTQSVTEQEVLVYGSLKVQTESAISGDSNFGLNIQASLGSSSSPGLVIGTAGGSWELQQIDLDLSGSFVFAGLSLHAEQLTMEYQTNPSQFQMSGTVFMNIQNASFTVSLGEVIVNSSGVQFDNVVLSLTNLNLGVFTVSEASLTINLVSGATSGTDVTIASSASISLPGGWSVGGSFGFEYIAPSGFQLQEIGVSAILGTDGLPIGDTDVFVTSISGELDGLGSQNWSVSGSLGVAFGQAIPLGDQGSVRIVQAVGGFTLDKDELILDGSVAFGGYYNSNNQLQSALGVLNGNVTLDWGDGTISASVNGSFLDGTFTVEGDFKYSQGNILFQAQADLNIPEHIPLIGGDTLASANFVFEYQYNNNSPIGFIAAWLDLPIIGDAGIEYNFFPPPGTDPFSFIGNAAVAGIEAGESQGEQYNTYSTTFTVPAGATYFNFMTQWVVNNGGDYYLTLTIPDSNAAVIKDQGGTITGGYGGIQFTDLGRLNPPPGQLGAGIAANNIPEELPSGTYTLTLFTQDTLDPNAIVWTGLAGYTTPNFEGVTFDQNGSNLSVHVPILLDPAFASQAKAALYMDTDKSGHNGVRVAGPGHFVPEGTEGFYTIKFDIELPKLAPPAGDYYFFIVADDGFHPPATSDYSKHSFVAQPQLTGTLTETGDGRNRPLGGWTVYIDLNGNGVFDSLFEPTAITESNTPLALGGSSASTDGTYSFYDNPKTNLSFQPGQSYTVGVALPAAGYDLPPGGSATTTFTYNGGTSTVDFQLWQQATIAGTVFNDLNGNGVLDPGEPGVGGVSVFLDFNNNGLLDLGEPTPATLNAGTYEFIGVASSMTHTINYLLPDDYLVSGGPTSYSVAVGSDAYARYDGNNFAIVQEATISGTVTGNTVFGGDIGPTPGPLSGWTVYLDLNDNGQLDSGEPSTTSDVNGDYQFTGLMPGVSYPVREQVPAGWQQVGPFVVNPSFDNNQPVFQPFDGAVSAVAIADFNNDGKLDYAAYLNGAQTINYYYGNGDGTFGSAQTWTEGLTASAIDMQTGDFNGDGFADLLVLGTDGWVRSVWGSATGFTGYEVLYGPTGDFAAYGIAAGGDWDGDGISDFAVYGRQTTDILGSVVNYFFVDVWSSSKDSNSRSTPLVRLVVGTVPQLPSDLGTSLSPTPSDHALAVGDLNNDGNLDLFMNFSNDPTFTGPGGPQTVWIAYGHGDGTFGQSQSVNLLNTNYYPDLSIAVPFNGGPAALGDINGDGILDAVTLASAASGSQIQQVNFIQQTSFGSWYDLGGNFSSTSNFTLSFSGPPNGPNAGRTFVVPQVAIADINGDGKRDVLLVELPDDSGTGQTLTYLNQGNTVGGTATFNTNTNASPPAFFFTNLADGSKPNSMALGDYNNDGQVDVILGDAVYNGGGVWLLTNTSEAVGMTINAEVNQDYVVNFANLQFGQAQTSGAAFVDGDGDGRRDAAEAGLAGVTVFLDLDNDGVLDANEPFRTTNSAGYYAFAGLTPGLTGRLRVLSGLTPDQGPAAEEGLLVTLGQSSGSVDLAIRQRLLQPIADATGAVDQLLSLGATLTNSAHRGGTNLGSGLVFSLEPGAPAGLSIDPVSGVISWVPGAHQAPGSYKATVRVRDPHQPLRTDTRTFSITVPATPPVTPPMFTAVAVKKAGGSVVRVFNADGSLRFTLKPFRRFRGKIRVAVGDVNGDGVTDIIVSAGPGGPAGVKVYDGLTGKETLSFRPYGKRPKRGVSVAAADVLKTGLAQIVTGLGPDGGFVRLFDGRTGKALSRLF